MRTAAAIEMFGGSHAGAYGNSTSATSTGRLVASNLGATLAAYASNSLVLAQHGNGYAKYLRPASVRRTRPDTVHGWPAAADLVIVNCGLGDLASSMLSGGTWRPRPFRGALDAICAFAALSAYYPAQPAGASDPTITYGGTWIDSAATDHNTGTGLRSTFAADATLTLAVPATFPGTDIVLFWVVLPSSFNATITWDIKTAGVTATNLTEQIRPADADQVTTDRVNIKATRITGLKPGAHTITTTARDFAGFGCGFLGWGITAPTPPNVLLCSQLKAPQPALDGFLGPFPGDTPTAATIDRLNAEIADVANLSIPAVYHPQPDVILEQPNMTVDGIHPNDSGARLLAAALLDAIDDLPPQPYAPPARPLPIAPAANWTNPGGNYAPATYTLHRDLQVRLAGRVQRTGTPTAPELLLTLPEAHRPATTVTFACPASTGAAATVDVTPDGSVTYRAGTLGAGGTIDLDPIVLTARDDGT